MLSATLVFEICTGMHFYTFLNANFLMLAASVLYSLIYERSVATHAHGARGLTPKKYFQKMKNVE